MDVDQLKQFIYQGGYCTYNRVIAEQLGITCSIYLCTLIEELCYQLSEKGKIDSQGFFTIYSSVITQRTTLTGFQQMKASEKLVEFKLIDTELRGKPSQKFFRINFDKIQDFYTRIQDDDGASFYAQFLAENDEILAENQAEKSEFTNSTLLSKGQPLDSTLLDEIKPLDSTLLIPHAYNVERPNIRIYDKDDKDDKTMRVPKGTSFENSHLFHPHTKVDSLGEILEDKKDKNDGKSDFYENDTLVENEKDDLALTERLTRQASQGSQPPQGVQDVHGSIGVHGVIDVQGTQSGQEVQGDKDVQAFVAGEQGDKTKKEKKEKVKQISFKLGKEEKKDKKKKKESAADLLQEYAKVVNYCFRDHEELRDAFNCYVVNYFNNIEQKNLVEGKVKFRPSSLNTFKVRIQEFVKKWKKDGKFDVDSAIKAMTSEGAKIGYADFVNFDVNEKSFSSYNGSGKRFIDPTAGNEDSEPIDEPDFESMTKAELKEWVRANYINEDAVEIFQKGY